MKKMKTQLYRLTALSNMHAGAGGSNYGVIDNLVQRDFTDQFPAIYASSLKGAFKEWYESLPGARSVGEVFGSANDGKGGLLFTDAHLLALPVRSNTKPFLMATSPLLLKKFRAICTDDFDLIFDKPLNDVLGILTHDNVPLAPEIPLLIGESPEAEMRIEGYETIGRFPENTSLADQAILNELHKLVGKHSVVLLSDADMMHQCSDYELPVLARNKLENGQSANLWYEQVMPRQSAYYFLTKALKPDMEVFEDELNKKPVVQIGANATIGYGRCAIQPLTLGTNESN